MLAQALAWTWLAAIGAGAPGVEDWTETAKQWQYQSYWNDPKILQKYTFTPNRKDKVVGASSVEVHMQVAPKTRRLVELRLIPPKPLDLSKTEAVELHLKLLEGDGLRPAVVVFCNPGFRKLATVGWPKGLTLSSEAGWQTVRLDLTDPQILDKDKPGPDAAYDLHDVATINLNFYLPEGEVDVRLLIDGMRTVKLPPPPVKRTGQPDGSFVMESKHYRAVVGANGYLQSIRAGTTEFLKPCKADSATASAFFVNDRVARHVVPLGTPKPVGRSNLKIVGKKATLRYVFREADFDIEIAQKISPASANLHLCLSTDVVAALDGRTDRVLKAGTAGRQIHARLVTGSGGVLLCRQPRKGYENVATGTLPDKTWSLRLQASGSSPQAFTIRPVASPTAVEAIGLTIESASSDFLLPGDKPVRFDITATNYASATAKGRITFEVLHYLTRKPVGQSRVTPLDLKPKQTLTVATDVPLGEPGPYRARTTVIDASGRQRAVEWIFTYDFANYKPALTRSDDFDAFWKETLAELAKVPMDAKITPVPEENTATAEAFKVSLATLGGRRVHAWYWRPKKPGTYPAQLQLPSSGVYPRQARHVSHGPDSCGMWIAIHGLPVDVDMTNRADDPAAWNYWTHGIASPKTAMWRTIYASLVRAMDFLASRKEVDPKRIMVTGGSQGGGLTMVLAGLDRRVAFAAPTHSGLPRLDWTVLHKPGFWPFDMTAKPDGQSTGQFLKTLSYFDAANFTPDITCPVFGQVGLLDTVTAGGNQVCALAHVKPGLLELVCEPWKGHASSVRGQRLYSAAIRRWLRGEPPVTNPVKPASR